MKIVHVETGRNFYGGAQQVIWLIQGLAEHAAESVLVCPADAAIDSVAREKGSKSCTALAEALIARLLPYRGYRGL